LGTADWPSNSRGGYSGGEVLMGLGTIVLGLLAVIGIDSLTLVLVAS
jgi:hypothetical protein